MQAGVCRTPTLSLCTCAGSTGHIHQLQTDEQLCTHIGHSFAAARRATACAATHEQEHGVCRGPVLQISRADDSSLDMRIYHSFRANFAGDDLQRALTWDKGLFAGESPIIMLQQCSGQRLPLSLTKRDSQQPQQAFLGSALLHMLCARPVVLYRFVLCRPGAAVWSDVVHAGGDWHEHRL